MSNLVLTAEVFKSIQERASDVLRQSFMSMIPDQVLESLVKEALEEFIHGPKKYWYYSATEWMDKGDPRNPLGMAGNVSYIKKRESPVKGDGSPYIAHYDTNTLPGMVYAEIQKHAKEVLHSTLRAQLDPAGDYQSNVPGAPSLSALAEGAVRKWLDENHKLMAVTIMEGLVGNVMRQAVYNSR